MRSRRRSSSSATIVVVLIADFFFEYRRRFQTSQIATIGVLAALVPVATLAVDGGTRRMFSGAFVVDPYSLVLTGFFLAAAYVTLLLSVDYIGDGDYYQGEYYVLLLTSLLGMMVMTSARDLDHDLRGARDDLDPDVRARGLAQARPEVERGGDQVLPDRRALVRGHALRHVAGVRAHRLHAAARHRDRGPAVTRTSRCCSSPVFLTIVGFAFKVSAVPFHFWAPGHLRGRAHAGDRVPVGLVQGRRLRRAALDHLLRVLHRTRTAGNRCCGSSRRRRSSSATSSRCARRTSCACWRTRRSRRVASSSCRSRSAPDGERAGSRRSRPSSSTS